MKTNHWISHRNGHMKPENTNQSGDWSDKLHRLRDIWPTSVFGKKPLVENNDHILELQVGNDSRLCRVLKLTLQQTKIAECNLMSSLFLEEWMLSTLFQYGSANSLCPLFHDNLGVFSIDGGMVWQSVWSVKTPVLQCWKHGPQELCVQEQNCGQSCHLWTGLRSGERL